MLLFHTSNLLKLACLLSLNQKPPEMLDAMLWSDLGVSRVGMPVTHLSVSAVSSLFLTVTCACVRCVFL